MDDNTLLKAISRVQPTAKREGFATVPGVTWSDIGALTDVRIIQIAKYFYVCNNLHI